MIAGTSGTNRNVVTKTTTKKLTDLSPELTLTGNLTLRIVEAKGIVLEGKSDYDVLCIASIDSVPKLFRLPFVKARKPVWGETITVPIIKASNVLLYCGNKDEPISADRRPPTRINFTDFLSQQVEAGEKVLKADEWIRLYPIGRVHIIISFEEDPSVAATEQIHARHHDFEKSSFRRSFVCRYCDKFVWSNSFKCVRCQSLVHQKCAPFMAASCAGKISGKRALLESASKKEAVPQPVIPIPPPQLERPSSLVGPRDMPIQLAQKQSQVKASYSICVEGIVARNLHTNREVHQCYVTINWDNDAMATETVKSSSPTFAFYKNWLYLCAPSQLAERKVVIICYSKKSTVDVEEIGRVTHTLEDILTLPVHHDVMLTYNNKNAGRLAFDIRMEELCSISLQMKMLKAGTLKPLELASYYMQYTTHTDDESMDLELKCLPTEPTTTPQWEGECYFPEIKFSSTKNGLDQTKIHLRLYAKVDSLDAEDTVVGDGWISLSRYLNALSPSKNMTINFHCKLLQHRKAIGKLEGTFKMTGGPDTFQQQGGVKTESGIEQSSPIIVGNQQWGNGLLRRKGNTIPDEITTLEASLKDLDANFKLPMRKRNKEKEKAMFNSIHDILTSSHKTSVVSFTYANHDDLNQAIKSILAVWTTVLTNLDDANYDSKRVLYMIISGILQRSELSQQLMAINPSTITSREIALLVTYRRLLIQTMIYCIHKLNSHMMFDTLREFCARVLVVSYFQSEAMRKLIIPAILPPEKLSINLNSWRGTEFDIEAGHQGQWSDQLPAAMHILKNNADFLLKGRVDDKDLILDAANLPSNSTWLTQFSRSSDLFYVFVCHFCYHVYHSVVLKENLLWSMVPGYSEIVKAVLLEMEKLKPNQYPESMLKAIEYLLLNPMILNSLVYCAFGSTSLYDVDIVATTLTLLDSWLAVVGGTQEYTKPIPGTFDFEFFRQGLELMLGSDHCQIISNTLCLMYNHLETLCCHHSWRKALLSDLLLDRFFYALFLHYDFTVRQYFQTLLIYQILPVEICPLPAVPLANNSNLFGQSTSGSGTSSGTTTPQLNTTIKARASYNGKPSRSSLTGSTVHGSAEKGAGGGARSSLRLMNNDEPEEKESDGLQLPVVSQQVRLSFSEDPLIRPDITKDAQEKRSETHAKTVAKKFLEKIEYVRKRSKTYKYKMDGIIHEFEECFLKEHLADGPIAKNFQAENLIYASQALQEYDQGVMEMKARFADHTVPRDLPAVAFITCLEGMLDLTE